MEIYFQWLIFQYQSGIFIARSQQAKLFMLSMDLVAIVEKTAKVNSWPCQIYIMELSTETFKGFQLVMLTEEILKGKFHFCAVLTLAMTVKLFQQVGFFGAENPPKTLIKSYVFFLFHRNKTTIESFVFRNYEEKRQMKM